MAADSRPGPAIGIHLYWLRLGSRGSGFVRLGGRVYEAFLARKQGREPLDLYHAALEVVLPDERVVVETVWPIPDSNGESRGVVVEGPVFTRRLAWLRPMRYEVRCWRDGVIIDAGDAIGGPRLVSDEAGRARRLVDLASSVPALVWGNDELGTGEMWNSNSVVSMLLARSGVPMASILPPDGGRAPGWRAGVVAGTRSRSDPI